ncbi:hypothetical protein BDZ94DRAFT_1296501 [Collybia nuda]|uniref:Uncharacterized protein n=1 Tax=Collybia nuda TaxID=64659 RepID=A0A9P5Y8V9_9AGAR|nr:hypothetical protein BDZ94DRAFT_1296501 [Collybia nuda]
MEGNVAMVVMEKYTNDVMMNRIPFLITYQNLETVNGTAIGGWQVSTSSGCRFSTFVKGEFRKVTCLLGHVISEPRLDVFATSSTNRDLSIIEHVQIELELNSNVMLTATSGLLGKVRTIFMRSEFPGLAADPPALQRRSAKSKFEWVTKQRNVQCKLILNQYLLIFTLELGPKIRIFNAVTPHKRFSQTDKSN